MPFTTKRWAVRRGSRLRSKNRAFHLLPPGRSLRRKLKSGCGHRIENRGEKVAKLHIASSTVRPVLLANQKGLSGVAAPPRIGPATAKGLTMTAEARISAVFLPVDPPGGEKSKVFQSPFLSQQPVLKRATSRTRARAKAAFEGRPLNAGEDWGTDFDRALFIFKAVPGYKL